MTQQNPNAGTRAIVASAFAAAIILAAAVTPALAARLTGSVVDHRGRAIEYANVTVAALKLGAVTDTAGAFSLELPDGPVTIVCSQVGYQPGQAQAVIAGAPARVRIVLAEEPVPVAEVVVAASTFGKAGKSEGAMLRRMDVVTTPGGAADVFQSLRALPSINAPDEGAALYVRGGDPRETLIRLDGGEIGHPYHYEGASGGLFSAFDSYMLKSAFFSSGGFSAKYGGVLSGVLDIETADPMNLRTISAGANIVGGNVSGSWALIPDKLSLVGTVRGSDVKLLERLYPTRLGYVNAPASADGAVRLLYRHSPTGRVSLLYLGSADRVGLVTQSGNFQGLYDRHSHNHLLALQFQEAALGVLAIHGQVSIQRYRSQWAFGPTDVSDREAHEQANVDAVWAASPRHEVSFGGNWRRRQDDLSGAVPADSSDLAAGAPVRFRATRPSQDVPGAYVEDKVRLVGPIYATLGARADHVSLADRWTFDPRASVAWRIDDHQTLRVATGRYHQPADTEFLDPVYGNPHLIPLEADHWIAGYEWNTAVWNARVEAYRKDYRHLVTQSDSTFYSSDGTGYARGVDAIVRGQLGPVSGWISYGYQDSRRRERDDPREEPSAYGVPHSGTLVLEWALPRLWQVGGRYSYSTGRAYTPVIGRFYDAGRGIWRPVEGENQSARLPDYRRLDVRLTKLFSLPAMGSLPGSSTCVFYVEGMNVLDVHNVLDYVYNSDYSQRTDNLSYFSRRIAVVGFGLTW